MSKNKLSQSGLMLVQLLQTKRLRKDDLTPRQRKLVVKYFMEEQSEFSNVNIADLIGVTDMQVGRIKRELLKNSSWEIDSIDIKILAVALQKKKHELQRRAIEKADYGLAWKIETDFIEKMQSFGFVYRAPEKMDLVTRESDFERQLEEFFNAYGVPTVDEFIARLAGGRGTGGNGEGRLLGPGNGKPGMPKKGPGPDSPDRSAN